MYKLYKHQKRVNGEWVDDDSVTPSIDANGTRKKVISFTSDASCYNGDVINERWVDDEIIDADCNQKLDDYDDTKQEYLGCFDERTPYVIIKGGPENTKLTYWTNLNKLEGPPGYFNLDENGNGYFELKDDEILHSISLPTHKGQPDYPLSEVYIKGCNVTTANPFGGYGKIVFSGSTIISDKSNYSGYSGAYSYIYNGVDTSKSTNMTFMFSGCTSLTSLDLSGWNTSKVIGMDSMFKGCSGLTSLDVSHFNTSNVTDMGGMFYGCNGLTSLDVSNFNTSKVTDMSWMFFGCSGLTSLDVSNFNTSKVGGMSGMFRDCSGLTSLDVSHFNTSNVKYMACMFEGCSGLTSLDLSSFDTRNVTEMDYMFHGCSKLKSLDLSNFNTSKVTQMAYMFDYCISLTSLDLSGWGFSRTINKPTFIGCSKLKTIRMVGCDQDTIDVIKSILSKDGILNQVTIIT